ncbi:MAG TPA: histidine kinase, partial [Gemmatimonadales bacterium]|nr:histidine kinase [Gemmatimonadales bacterium]
RFRKGAFTPIATFSPGRPRYVNAGRDSSVWTSPWNEGTLQRFGPHGYDSVFPGTNSTGIAQDSNGATYVLEGSHILRLDGKEFHRIPLRKGSAKTMFHLTVDHGGRIWAYSQDFGLLRQQGDTMIRVHPLENQERTGMLFTDSRNTIWVAQRSRVTRVAGDSITQYGPEQGISGHISGFAEGLDGKVWAMAGGGFARYEGDRFHVLNARNGIRGMSVFGAAQDAGGNWWLNATDGVLRFPKGELEKALIDSMYSATSRLFDESDGTLGPIVKATWGQSLARSGDGKIWIATDSGLAFLDPERLPPVVPPPVTLEVARLAGREQVIRDGATVPPGISDLEIDYTSLTYATPERVRFRYRLDGADTAWREVGDRRRAYYTGLPPGDYRFRVSASYGDGLWNNAEAGWSFRMLPQWYQTIWFRLLAILATAGLGGAAVALWQRNRHERAQRRLQEKYEATLAERARIAQDLHDTLLQGFAGITLQLKTIELALPEEPDVAAETVQRVQQLARESLKEARERVWEMHEGGVAHHDLPAALEILARERTMGTGIGVSLVTTGQPRQVDPAIEDAVFRIGREAIVNAVRHAEAKRIAIHLDFHAGTLRLEVNDDGKGLAPDAAERARQQGHFGLSGMRERAEALGGSCELRARAEGGTGVILELPLRQPVPG